MAPSRRNILRAGIYGAAAAGLGAYIYARGPGRKGIVTREMDVPMAGLPEELDGFRVSHLSDFHIDPLMEQAHHAVAVGLSNAFKPDVVALTGDFVSDSGAAVGELSPVLGKLEARLGVYGCLGNHDGWHGAETVVRSLDRAGIRVLKNSGISLRGEGVPLYVAGLDSVWAGRPEPVKAVGGRRDDEEAILLCHEPDVFARYAGAVPFGLMLSGHTHGGQVRCPGFGAPVLPLHGRLFSRGLYERRGARLHVNPGIGTVSQHVRFFCRPEVTCLTLRRVV